MYYVVSSNADVLDLRDLMSIELSVEDLRRNRTYIWTMDELCHAPLAGLVFWMHRKWLGGPAGVIWESLKNILGSSETVSGSF